VRLMGTMMLMAAMAAFGQVNERKANQQARVGQGVQSGQMTAGEAAKVERKEAAIHREVRADRAANGGTLTPGEKAAVNRQQNRVSKQIYADKHNAAVQGTPKSEVGKRVEIQQQRVANGVASGKMTAGQAARVEGREEAIHKEVQTDRAANGGKLTPGEKAAVNRQQNRVSKKIYQDKH